MLLPRFYVNKSPIFRWAIHITIKTFVIFFFRYLFKITSRRHFPKTSKGKKTGINRKRPLFVALATEKDKDVDKNSCRNNQATEHGNNYDKNTRGSLFHLNRFGRLSHFVSNGISLPVHLVFAFTKKYLSSK